MNYIVRVTSAAERRQQREELLAALDRLGTASEEEIERVLAEREEVEPEPELTPEVVAQAREMIEQGMSRRRAAKRNSAVSSEQSDGLGQ